MRGNPRHSWIREFQVLDFSLWMSVERGFWIAIVSGIPDSLSCITDSQAQYTGFQTP